MTSRLVAIVLAFPLICGSLSCAHAGRGNRSAGRGYSGPVTDLKQIAGTWIHVPPDESVAVVTITTDGRITMTGVKQWKPDGTPELAEPETAAIKVIAAGQLQTTQTEAGQTVTDTVTAALAGRELTITEASGEQDDYRRPRRGQSVSDAIKEEHVGSGS